MSFYKEWEAVIMCRNQRMCESSYEREKSWTFQKSNANCSYNTASMSYYFYMYYNLVTPTTAMQRSYFALLHTSV